MYEKPYPAIIHMFPSYVVTVMFVRFRSYPHRLQISLVETHCVGGISKHKLVTSLGSIPVPYTAADRVEFFLEFRARINWLGDRVSHKQRAATISTVAKRVPFPTAEEIENTQIESALQAGAPTRRQRSSINLASTE